MPSLSDKQRIIVAIISGLVQTGVPMTPIAGTILGYCLLALAGILSFYVFYTWKAQGSPSGELVNTDQSHTWQPSAIKFALLIPTVLLFCMAIVWSYFGGIPALITPTPKLGLYFNGQPLEGQRIPIKMEVSGTAEYHISLWNIEIREEGRKVGAHISTPLWRLSEKEIKCSGECDDQDSEPSDSAQYPTVFRGRPFHVDVGGKSFIKQMTFKKHSQPPTEIRTELELRYGAPDPIHATFTMLPYK